jgi:hypothetical protein
MAVPGWVWVVLLVTAITITIRFLIMKSRETGGTSQPMLTTDQIIKQTGFDELSATTTTSSTDASGAMTTTTTDSTGKTMSVTTSKDGSTTQTTVKDKDGTVLADNKSSALDVIKTVAPTLLANIAAGVARDLVIIGGAKIISKASKEVAEKGVKSALQQGGKMVSRQGPELAMKFLGYVTKNSADKAAQAAAETGLRKAAKEAADKVAAAELKRLGKKAVSEITDKAAKEALEKAMEKAGKEAAEKAATEAAQKVASKAATTAAEKATAKLAGAAAAKIGAKAGMAAAKMGAKAGMGPVGVALMAFDVLSMALDIACCGGYCEAADIKTWEKQRDTFNGQVKAMVDDANESGIDPVRWPIITGPFDKLDAVTLQTRLMDKIRAAMADPENKYVKDVVAKLKTAVEAKTITDESQVDAFIDENIDLEGLLMDSTKAICTDLKGKLIMDGEKFAGCSWPDQAQCEASFKWPILEGNENDIYSIWNKEKQECNKDPVSQNMRGICEATKAFPYNKDTKICDLNETYCKQKGMKWDGKNCKLDKGQEVAEMMFGTTVVRGLNALYSPDQYESCPAGARPAGEIAALVGVATLGTGAAASTYLGMTMCASDKCPDGQDRVSGLCYDQCKTGYDDKSDGITGMKVQGMCYKCPDGFKKTTTGMCQRVSCPSGQEQGTGLGAGFCYKKCSDLHGGEYTESDGASICKKPCPAGMVQEALTCRRNAETKTSASAQKTCPSGWSQSIAGPGGMCQQDCTDGYKKYGGLCYHPNVDTSKLSRIPDKGACNAGDRDDGTSCFSPIKTSWNSCAYTIKGCKQWGKLTKLSLTNDHCKSWGDVCQGRSQTTGGTIVKTLMQRQSCPAGYSGPTGGFCYAVAKPPPASKPLTEVGQCNDASKPEGAGGMCYQKCSDFGGSFKRSAVGLCQMDVMVTERTKTRAPEGPFVVAKPADQYSREPLGISYKVFPKKRKVPFGKGPNGC